jgi:hypothetical protein
MPETDLFRLFTDRLNLLGARYIVTGSVAGTLYGEPRLTLDVDIVWDLGRNGRWLGGPPYSGISRSPYGTL